MATVCQKKIEAVLAFADWAINALADQANLSLGLSLSEHLLGEHKKETQ